MSEVKEQSGSSPDESQQEQGQVQESQVSVDDLQKEVEGLKQGIQAERDKRQSVEQQYKLMEQLAMASQSQQNTQAEQFDPDDVPTNATVQKMVQKAMSQVQNQTAQLTKAQQLQMLKQQDPDADKLVGIGSYYDQIQQQIPGLNTFLENHPQGVEIAYRLGKTHPEYQKILQEKAAQEVVSKTEKNLSKPPKIQGGGEVEKYPDFSKMSEEEIDREIWRVKGY